MTLPRPGWLTLKRLLLAFWAAWLTLVVLGNVCDALAALGFLPTGWKYVSGNFATILEVLAPFDLPEALGAALYAGVIAWEALAMVLFWRSAVTFRGMKSAVGRGSLVATFAVSLGLWGAFQIACEALPSPLAYRLAATHRILFIESLATLLAIVLLPDE